MQDSSSPQFFDQAVCPATRLPISSARRLTFFMNTFSKYTLLLDFFLHRNVLWKMPRSSLLVEFSGFAGLFLVRLCSRVALYFCTLQDAQSCHFHPAKDWLAQKLHWFLHPTLLPRVKLSFLFQNMFIEAMQWPAFSRTGPCFTFFSSTPPNNSIFLVMWHFLSRYLEVFFSWVISL